MANTEKHREDLTAPVLGERKAAVLRAVVEEYVRSGEPVGSETIAERSGLRVSPATIRNELSALEELGFLTHPHTSAGRVPTDLGYRFYVDTIPAGGRLNQAQRKAIAGFFAETMWDLEEVLRGTTQLLSRVTQYAGLAVPPSPGDERVLRVELVELGAAIMVLVVGHSGRVDKQVIDQPEGVDAGMLRSFERRLAERFNGMTLAEAKKKAIEFAAGAEQHDQDILIALAQTFGDMQKPSAAHVVIGGVANLADEAMYWRRATLRRLFEALEHESEMLGLLRDITVDEDLAVTIGGEHPATGEWEASIVAAPFRAGETSLGTIGVVGPTRMDYVNVMASVRAVARRLSELATALEG